MQMEPVLLGVDIGTSGAKGTLITLSGKVLGTASRSHTTGSPRPGWAEHDADKMWWDGFVHVVRQLLTESGVDARNIAGVGCSTIGPCLLPVDEQGVPLRQAILYGIDGRASEEIAELDARMGAGAALDITANPITTQSLMPKAMWVRDHEPDVWERTHLLLDAPGYLAFKLTGRFGADLFTSCAGGLIDIHRLERSQAVFEAAGVPIEKFAEPVWPATVVGGVSAEAAKICGLAQGTPVIAGTVDAAVECLGAGMTEDGEVCLTYGTTAVILACSESPHTHRSLFGGVYCLKDRYILGGATAAAGALTTWHLDTFGADIRRRAGETGVSPYELQWREAVGAPAGAKGLVVLPHFGGARTPVNDERGTGVMVGLTLQHTTADVYRALLESVGYEVRHHIDVLREAGVDPRSIRAVGGGTRNPLWTQIVSDITGLEQTCVSNPIGAPLGVAYLAALGVGLVDGVDTLKEKWVSISRVVMPDAAAGSVYGKLYEVYRQAYPATAGLSHALGAVGTLGG